MSNQLLRDVEQPGQENEEEEETEAKKGGDEEQKQEADDGGEEPKGENPFEKYMKMVLEAREKQQQQQALVGCIHICLSFLSNFAFVA